MITLGGAKIKNSGVSASSLDKEKEGFDALWSFLQSAGHLDCTKLRPFEGADVKWEKMVKAKDRAEAQASHTAHVHARTQPTPPPPRYTGAPLPLLPPPTP